MEGFSPARRVAGALIKATLVTALVGSFAFGSVQLMGRGSHSSGSGTCTAPSLTGPTGGNLFQSFTIDGCGFEPGAIVPLVGAEANGCCFTVNMVADSSGRFSWTGQVWSLGEYSYKAMVQTNRGWRTAATWTFDAY